MIDSTLPIVRYKRWFRYSNPVYLGSKTSALVIAIMALTMLTSCQDASHPSTEDSVQIEMHDERQNPNVTTTEGQDLAATGITSEDPTETSNHQTGSVLQVDWSKIDSGVPPIAATNYDYPFALDSQPVTSYMSFFDVDAATAQHNLTVGMASNEALSRVLDQLTHHYISHELTDGDDIKLIIHTTADVAPSRHDYIFADEFARGLSLPIIIQPKETKRLEQE